jgi:hypothetical protein
MIGSCHILDTSQNVTMPQCHNQSVAACMEFIRLCVNGGAHGPADDSVDVVRGLRPPLDPQAAMRQSKSMPTTEPSAGGDKVAQPHRHGRPAKSDESGVEIVEWWKPGWRNRIRPARRARASVVWEDTIIQPSHTSTDIHQPIIHHPVMNDGRPM